MENNITLTIDEIHAIRVEHSEITKDLPFAEYRKQLDDEIAPALHMLEEMKKANAKEMVNSIKE
jgi:hypothetical protein